MGNYCWCCYCVLLHWRFSIFEKEEKNEHGGCNDTATRNCLKYPAMKKKKKRGEELVCVTSSGSRVNATPLLIKPTTHLKKKKKNRMRNIKWLACAHNPTTKT